MLRIIITFLILAVSTAQFSHAAKGPTIRAVELKPGARALDVQWTTEMPGDSVIKIDSKVVKDDRMTTSHLVTVTNLTPNTPYLLEVSSSDGKLTSHYRNRIKTDAPHDNLIRQYGKALIESLEEKMGPLDEERLDPKVESYLALVKLFSLRKGVHQYREKVAECDKSIATMESLHGNLQSGKAGEALPKTLQAELDAVTALAPEADAADFTIFLQTKISLEIKQLREQRAEHARKQAEIENEAAVWAGKLKAAKAKQ